MPEKILIVDDEPEIIEIFKELFMLKGYEVDQAGNAAETLEKIESFKPDLITLDINFGHGQEAEGINIVKLIRSRWSVEELLILIVSAKGTSDNFLDAKENGADAVVLKSKVEDVMHKAEELLRGKDHKKQAAAPLPERMRGRGTNANMIKLLEWAEQDCDILILGETGTGKSLAAETYRLASHRRNKFYKINLATLTENLIQSELFGAMRGAFTDAKERKGMIEEADKGILFFDEIGELSLDQQKNLLDFMDTREITRLGSTHKVKLDVVILAATNKDLPDLQQKRQFRPDLFRRLWHNVITMPPLREITQDIPMLAEGFVKQFNQKYRKQVRGIAPEVMRLFIRLPWYGNTGELKYCIGNGVLNCSTSMIRLEDIEGFLRPEYLKILHGEQPLIRPAVEAKAAAAIDPPATLQALRDKQEAEERQMLERAYIESNRNQTKAAKRLGISRERYIQLLKKHGIK